MVAVDEFTKAKIPEVYLASLSFEPKIHRHTLLSNILVLASLDYLKDASLKISADYTTDPVYLLP